MRQILVLTIVLTVAGNWRSVGAASATESTQQLFQEDKGKKGAGGKKAKKEAREEDEARPTASAGEFRATGSLKEVKGTPFYNFDYTANDGKKPAKKSAFVKLGDKVDIFTDKVIRVVDLKQGDAVWLLGYPFESDARGGPGGFSGTDRQMKNVLAIARGEGLEVSRRYKDARDPNVRWCEVTISKAGESIDVQFEGSKYKVVLGKGALVLHRERAGDAKALKSGLQVEVHGGEIDEKPETKNANDARKSAFEAKRIVILDRRLQATIYPAING